MSTLTSMNKSLLSGTPKYQSGFQYLVKDLGLGLRTRLELTLNAIEVEIVLFLYDRTTVSYHQILSLSLFNTSEVYLYTLYGKFDSFIVYI